MSLMEWEVLETPERNVFTSEASDYAIHQHGGKFYVHCDFADRDDIGPLDDFKQAEDIVMKINLAMVAFEEKVWRVSAALELKVLPAMDDGTANQIEELA